jgi:DNA replication protein DnaC
MHDVRSIFAEVSARLEQEDREAAEAAGVTVDEFRRQRTAERTREANKKQAEQDLRAEAACRSKWIETWKSYLPEASCAELYDGKSQQTDAIRHTKTWLGTDTPCLILCGGVGTGKTHAAIWAVRERWGEFVASQSLARRIDPWKHELEHTRLLHLEAPLIVLDDLGAEQDDARFGQALFALVNCRNASDRRTLITTNLTIPQIRPRYGDRIADRLNAMAKAVQLKGASMRKHGAGL